MKKTYKNSEFTEKNSEFTEKRCADCNKFLKKNLIFKRPNANLCYRCFYLKERARRGVNVNAP